MNSLADYSIGTVGLGPGISRGPVTRGILGGWSRWPLDHGSFKQICAHERYCESFPNVNVAVHNSQTAFKPIPCVIQVNEWHKDKKLDLENAASSTLDQPPGTLFHPTFATLLTPVHSENDSKVYCLIMLITDYCWRSWMCHVAVPYKSRVDWLIKRWISAIVVTGNTVKSSKDLDFWGGEATCSKISEFNMGLIQLAFVLLCQLHQLPTSDRLFIFGPLHFGLVRKSFFHWSDLLP